MRFLPVVLASVFGLANAFPRRELYLYSPKKDKTWKGVSPQVVYLHGAIWVGTLSRHYSPEPFVPHMVEDTGYTASNHNGSMVLDQRPWTQTAFIYEKQTQPVRFTPDYSSVMPAEGSDHGFEISDKGGITFKGQNKFVGCQDDLYEGPKKKAFKIFWQGAEAAKGDDGKDGHPLTLRMKQK